MLPFIYLAVLRLCKEVGYTIQGYIPERAGHLRLQSHLRKLIVKNFEVLL